MFLTMVLAALTIELAFDGLGLIPSGARPTTSRVFGSVTVNYKLVLNAVAVLVFVALLWLTARRGATDPICGMRVDRSKALGKRTAERTLYFCSPHCLRAFEASEGDG
jgi:YHS domain-containing protein